ncbi:hypothetical protein JCGZ_15270 [Jatropha curcas]|uniref:Uncharacterized protein n=1 Tax=Jatropha curcas TaxID=180498 RepID=A0A067K2W4_JATCU|nr:hypothetical protein JCGZ_15270 [Jatropha curcas]
MNGNFIRSSDHSSLCVPTKPFEHNGNTYLGLEIFNDVIDIVKVEPQRLKNVKEVKEEEGIETLKMTKNEGTKRRITQNSEGKGKALME